MNNPFKWLPNLPRPLYTVFAGTSTASDALLAVKHALAPSRSIAQRDALAAQFGAATGCAPAALFGAGRMGLYAILEALALKPGDQIILPAFTCAVVPNALLYRGLQPVYADISPVTFNIDPAKVLTAITPRTRAIYAQHTFGVACDIRRLRAIATEQNLLLIEDLAHALGASVDGKPVGSFGDAGFGSTDRTKVINTHVGGWASSPNPSTAAALRAIAAASPALPPGSQRRAAAALALEIALRAPSTLWLGRPILGALRRLGLEFVWRDEQMNQRPTNPPYPCQFPESLIASAAAQLADLSENLRHRRTVAAWLESRIHWYAPALPSQAAFDAQAWLRYSFLVRDRAEFIRRFGTRIDLGTWFTEPIFGRPTTADQVGYAAGSCPIAEHAAAHVVNFPTHPRIPIALLEELFARHGDWLQSQILRPAAG